MEQYILSLDQGTSSSRAIVFDRKGQICSMAQREFTQIFPKPGWVEHNPHEIWSSQASVIAEAIAAIDINGLNIAGIGITNQRETTIVWDSETEEPVYNAIVWQDRRTSEYCDRLKADGLGETVTEKTGLLIDAYFSGTKLKWIMDNIPGVRQRAERGELCAGTVDSWLIWNLTGGKAHVTDYSNASRTMLFNIHTLQWDPALCAALDIPMDLLPEPKSNSEVYGHLASGLPGLEDLAGIPVCGSAGDQQSALFGQACFTPGQAKNTYGTGCFTLMNVGDTPVRSRSGLVTSVGWQVAGKTVYALEGSVFNAGSTIQWLRDELGLIQSAPECDRLAESVPDSGGVVVVPAFTGLGAPYWDMYARGAILGITRGTTQNHIIRAAEESIAYQSYDLVHAMELDVGQPITALKVDGGASRDQFLMQFQADILNKTVLRPAIRETTALGAAYLAGLATGVWKDRGEIRSLWHCNMTFTPNMEAPEREKLLAGWHKAVGRSRDWAEHE